MIHPESMPFGVLAWLIKKLTDKLVSVKSHSGDCLFQIMCWLIFPTINLAILKLLDYWSGPSHTLSQFYQRKSHLKLHILTLIFLCTMSYYTWMYGLFILHKKAFFFMFYMHCCFQLEQQLSSFWKHVCVCLHESSVVKYNLYLTSVICNSQCYKAAVILVISDWSNRIRNYYV